MKTHVGESNSANVCQQDSINGDVGCECNGICGQCDRFADERKELFSVMRSHHHTYIAQQTDGCRFNKVLTQIDFQGVKIGI